MFNSFLSSLQLPTTPTLDDFRYLSYHLHTDSSCSSLVITDEDGTMRRPRARSLRWLSLSLSLSISLSLYFSLSDSLFVPSPSSRSPPYKYIHAHTCSLHVHNTLKRINTHTPVLSVPLVRFCWIWTQLTTSLKTSIPKPKRKWRKDYRCVHMHVHICTCMQHACACACILNIRMYIYLICLWVLFDACVNLTKVTIAF